MFAIFIFSYEVLIKDERMTTQELNALEKRIESWSQVCDLK